MCDDLFQCRIFCGCLGRQILFRLLQAHLRHIFICRLVSKSIRGIAAVPVHLLLQQAGVAFAGAIYVFHKRAARFAQIQVTAPRTFLGKRLSVMVLEDLACSGFQNGVHRVTVDIAVVKIFILLTSDTGIDVSVTLQQEKFLSAIIAVGAVFRSELIEPCTVDPRIQIGPVKSLVHPPVENQLFLFTHVMQQATGIVVKPDHEIKIIHVQACVTVQESDIFNDLIQLFKMLLKDRGRYFFLVRNLLQQSDIIQYPFQCALSALGHPVFFMQGKRQIQAARYGHVELPDGLDMSVQSVQIRLDVGMSHPEAGIRDEFTHVLIVSADILDQVVEFLLW